MRGSRRGGGLVCWAHRDQGLLWEHVLEALLHQLVSAADQLEAVDGVELMGHLSGAEGARRGGGVGRGARRRHEEGGAPSSRRGKRPREGSR